MQIPDSTQPMSVRAYGRRRGCSHVAVQRAIENGRLVASIVRGPNGEPKISDPDLADREWAANTDYTDSPQRAAAANAQASSSAPPSAPLTIDGAAARQKHWAAKLAELKFKEAAGELIRIEDAEADAIADYSEVKTKLLAIASRAKQAIPHMTIEDLLVWETLIREALEALSDD